MTACRPARPADVEALARLMAGREPIHAIAGGTDLLVEGRTLPRDGVLVDLSLPAYLRGIDTDRPDVHIGATTAVAAIEAHAALARRFPALVQAAADFGSVQIRNRATIGGNIANGAAAADLLPPLLLADARIEGIAPGGARREIALETYRPGSGLLILKVILPASAAVASSAFVKLGPRREPAIARLNMAASAVLRDRRLSGVRILAGALAPRPIALVHAAAALEGRPLGTAALRGFLDALSAEVDGAIAGRGSQPWKRQAIRGLGIDLIARLLGLSNRAPLFAELA